jgi:hypothetical protein
MKTNHITKVTLFAVSNWFLFCLKDEQFLSLFLSEEPSRLISDWVAYWMPVPIHVTFSFIIFLLPSKSIMPIKNISWWTLLVFVLPVSFYVFLNTDYASLLYGLLWAILPWLIGLSLVWVWRLIRGTQYT